MGPPPGGGDWARGPETRGEQPGISGRGNISRAVAFRLQRELAVVDIALKTVAGLIDSKFVEVIVAESKLC